MTTRERLATFALVIAFPGCAIGFGLMLRSRGERPGRFHSWATGPFAYFSSAGATSLMSLRGCIGCDFLSSFAWPSCVYYSRGITLIVAVRALLAVIGARYGLPLYFTL